MNDSLHASRSPGARINAAQGSDRFSLLADHSLDGVFVIEGRAFSYVNPRFCHLVGRSREDLLGQNNPLDIAHRDSRAEFESAIIALHEGKETSVTLDFTILHGERGLVELRASLVAQPGAGKLVLLGSVQDVGETTRLKESLRGAEERFRYAARATQELIWECNLANGRLWCNEGIMTVFKRSSDSAPKELEHLIECVHADDRETVRDGLAQLSEGKKPLWLSEFRFQRGDGAWAHVLARAFVLFDSKRKPLRLIGTMFDNTQHRTMESRLIKSQRLSSLGAIANGLAHDVNNLLTPILTAAQRLKEDVFIDEGQTALLETIENNCLRGAALTEELMKIGDGQSGGIRPLRSNDFIESVVMIFRETFPKDIYILYDTPEDLHQVLADELQIDQILMNLCIHARDQMPNGGELRITSENVRLDAQFALSSERIEPGPFVRIRVKDTGQGYAPDELRRLFGPTQEDRAGEYLGLVTVDAIVDKLGGDIVVDSQPGNGTSFEVYLPAVISGEAETGAEAAASAPRGNGELIMLVDDEPKVRDLTQETLEHYGYKVVTANNGAEAVTVYCQRRQEISAVLMDLKMPVMDGVTAITVLRGINPHVMIIATTGSFDGLEQPHAPGREIDGCLRKPYTNARLLKVLGEVVNRR